VTPLAPPPLRDDCFALPSGVDWTPVDVALHTLQQNLKPVVGQTSIPVMDAMSCVVAQDVLALRANPPTANSAVDGYGFAYASLPDGDPVLPLVEGRAAAGKAYGARVPEGHAIRVLTGTPLPEGVDTVILEEDVNTSDTAIAFRAGIKPQANSRKAGEDVEKDAVILPKGRVLTAPDLALAATTGHDRLPVFNQLRVALLSTGDELVALGEDASSAQIFDANGPMLTAWLKERGYKVIPIGPVPDCPKNMRNALDDAASKSDVIITTGGASAGDEDHLSALLTSEGSMSNWRVAVKPGRPMAMGFWHAVPVFGLPGNPVAAWVCSMVFAAPALRVLSGANWHKPSGFLVPAAFSKTKKPGRREFLRARVCNGMAEVYHSEGSGRIHGLSWSTGLVELPDEAVTVSPGDMVRFLPYVDF